MISYMNVCQSSLTFDPVTLLSRTSSTTQCACLPMDFLYDVLFLKKVTFCEQSL